VLAVYFWFWNSGKLLPDLNRPPAFFDFPGRSLTRLGKIATAHIGKCCLCGILAVPGVNQGTQFLFLGPLEHFAGNSPDAAASTRSAAIMGCIRSSY
jgi:hypothetical protein